MAKKRKSGKGGTSPANEGADEDQQESTHPDFLIVGVGASAGGLDAFSQLLRALPAEPNFATVIVQHMSPQHESALPSLLAGSTAIPIVQVRGETKIEPGTIYVVPPNKTLALADGDLELLPRPLDNTQYHPIDSFFISLAEKMGDRAVGIILSGMGHDGVDGMHAIKARGGITIAQDPESAKYDSMPRAAVGTGKVDLVLNPAEMAAELVRLADSRPAHAALPPKPGDALTLEARHLERIFGMLRAASGVDFSQYKMPTVQRRIQRRMAMHKVVSVDHYVRYLQENPNEITLLYQDILIHVTRFFREPESFAALTQEVFPALVENRLSEMPLRIWVPGCSTGEEPYSVAMALVEYLEDIPVQIFATDVSDSAIERARSGVFPPSIEEDVSGERLRRFFAKTDGHYRINKSIRDLCVFARQDLTRDPPFSRLDLIVCRNVLIYLGQAVQNRLINVFHYALRSTGFLMLGNAETIGPHGDLFAITDKKYRVYRKKVADTLGDVDFSVPVTRPAPDRPIRLAEETRGATNLQAEVNRLVLDRYAPPGVVVNEELRIIQFRGQTGRFLEPAPGDASLNLLKMCREGLLYGLRTAITNARKKESPVRREGLKVRTNGGFADVAIDVVPIATGEGRHFLILFHEQAHEHPPARSNKRARTAKAGSQQEHEQEIERLQAELFASREYLQSIIQDLEAANEELQSANEEILSSNEELQSTNEELDTAKEELQSTNEELNTVNEELHSRNEELARINSDLVNLLNGVRIAIVIVAGDQRIRRFTPMAERVLNLIPGDIGRPISQIKPNINCPDLERLITEAIDSVSVQHREVQDSQGKWFSLTIRPYKNIDNRIDGAVLALFDIDEIRRHENEAQEARDYVDVLLQTIQDAVLVLDADSRVRAASGAFCKQFKTSPAELENHSLAEICNGQLNRPEVEKLIANAQASNGLIEGIELKCELPGESLHTLRVNARRVGSAKRRSSLILLSMDDGASEH